MREIRTSGSVRGEGGNPLAYSTRRGQGQVPGGRKMRNEPNLPPGALGPAESIAPNKASFALEGVGREPVLSLPKERPTHEGPRAIVQNKANSPPRLARLCGCE